MSQELILLSLLLIALAFMAGRRSVGSVVVEVETPREIIDVESIRIEAFKLGLKQRNLTVLSAGAKSIRLGKIVDGYELTTAIYVAATGLVVEKKRRQVDRVSQSAPPVPDWEEMR